MEVGPHDQRSIRKQLKVPLPQLVGYYTADPENMVLQDIHDFGELLLKIVAYEVLPVLMMGDGKEKEMCFPMAVSWKWETA